MEKVTEDIINIGVNDRELTLFEGQYEVKNGMAYNSYVILDEQVVVMDGCKIWRRQLAQGLLIIWSFSIWNQTMAAVSCS